MRYLVPIWVCSDCQKYKRLEDFNKSTTLKTRPVQHKCRECEKEYRRQNSEKIRIRQLNYQKTHPHIARKHTKNWRIKNKVKRQQYLDKNKEKIAAQRQDYYKRKKDRILSKNKEWLQNNREKQKEQKRKYYKKNKERIDNYRRGWNKKNKDKINRRNSIAAKLRRNTDYQFVIANRMRKLLRYGLKTHKKEKKTISLLNYSLPDLVKHIESTFMEGMSWEKLLKGEIEIHHIVPAAAFEYTSETDEAFKLCWSLPNLCAEWSILNRRLNDSLPDGTNAKKLVKKIKNKTAFDYWYSRCLAMRVVKRLES